MLAFLRNRSGDRVGFADLLDRSQATTVAGVSVQVAGLDDIIESKWFADRPKAREALPELEQLLVEPES